MTEKLWVETIKEYLQSLELSKNIMIDMLAKISHAYEILEYNKGNAGVAAFEFRLWWLVAAIQHIIHFRKICLIPSKRN